MSEKRKITSQHNEIRSWVEKHGGRPARIRGSTSADRLSLRFLFLKSEEAFLTFISWDDFFRQFDREELAVLTVEDDDSNDPFYRFVSRNEDFDSLLKSFDDEAPIISPIFH